MMQRCRLEATASYEAGLCPRGKAAAAQEVLWTHLPLTDTPEVNKRLQLRLLKATRLRWQAPLSGRPLGWSGAASLTEQCRPTCVPRQEHGEIMYESPSASLCRT